MGGIGVPVSGAFVGPGVVVVGAGSVVPEETGGAAVVVALELAGSGAVLVELGVFVSPLDGVWLFMTMVTGAWFVELSGAGAVGVVGAMAATLLVAGGAAEAAFVSGEVADAILVSVEEGVEGEAAVVVGSGVGEAPEAGAEKPFSVGCVTSGPGTFKVASSARS